MTEPTGPDCVVVTSHTDRGNDPLVDLAGAFAVLGARHPGVLFLSATLDGSATTVTEALDQAADAGCRWILLVSGQTLPDRPVTAWFRRVIGHWLRLRAADACPRVQIAPPLTGTEGFADLITEAVTGPAQDASTRTAPLTSPLWEQVPAFARHVLVCRGPRCAAQGSGETVRELNDQLYRRGLTDDQVLVTQTGCMFPCGQAPVVAVYPDNTWYARIRPGDVDRLIDEHLIGGCPLPDRLGARKE